MEPLAQLKDIHLPEQVNNYPLSLGWWLLVIVIISMIIFIIIQIKRSKQGKRCQQQAIKQLKDQAADNHSTSSVLKWAAMQYFPRDNIARLYGAKFNEFLINALPEKHQESFATISSQSFASLYQDHPMTDNQQQLNDEFKQAALLWLTYALPPKTPKVKPQTKPAKYEGAK
ncbi:MAG: ABC-type transport system involved in Fe-S cluster assembly fused permease/ATPase subunit [Alteromonadaceae bacterium]|jgi:ABC-type transport system involved in Fe-S cluster assembly fused permease/ATPase subunit